MEPLFALPKQAISINVVMLILVGIALIGADWLFGPYGPDVASRLLYVLVFLLIGFVITGAKPLPDIPASQGAMQFGAAAIATYVVMLVMGWFSLLPGSILQLTEPLAASAVPVAGGILIVLLLAYSEELIFRYVLPKAGKLGFALGAVVFGLFHVFVLLTSGLSYTSFQFISAIGLLAGLSVVWTYIAYKTPYGLMGAVGSHMVWNLRAFGII